MLAVSIQNRQLSKVVYSFQKKMIRGFLTAQEAASPSVLWLPTMVPVQPVVFRTLAETNLEREQRWRKGALTTGVDIAIGKKGIHPQTPRFGKRKTVPKNYMGFYFYDPLPHQIYPFPRTPPSGCWHPPLTVKQGAH